MAQKIGLYGGTFDPIHFGHLNLVLEMKEIVGFDEMWLIPTGINPFKVDQTVTPSHHRLEMARLAVEDFAELKVLDIEVKREGITYAIDTLQEFFQESADREYSIIIGDDAASGFFQWKDVNKILDMVSIYVGRRSCQSRLEGLEGDPEILEVLKQGLIQTKVLEISSTDIRRRMALGLSCSHLLPSKIIDYIYINQLYC
ncbi:MAG: Nicotinate-nucleotide adenylyltransferase [Chlamydiae bacterium]|nr:Nicotinate-nucleotide adenylyltransferase [Chlamydiota bacterium]